MPNTHAPRITRFGQVAAIIEARLSADPSYRVPTITVLAREQGISLRTAWKALRHLAKRGVLSRGPGKRAMYARPGENAGTPASIERFAQTIRERIQHGVYRLHAPLPKASYFTGAERISSVTIGQALGMLEREGLINKFGRKWIVGAQSRAYEKSGPAAPPVVLVVLPDERHYLPFFHHEFLSSFVVNFLDEMDAHRIDLNFAIFRGNRQKTSAAVPVGIKEIHNAIIELGPRYGGTFISEVPAPLPGFAEFLAQAGRMGKPVVLLDADDRNRNYHRGLPGMGKAPFFRCHIDEQEAVAMAIRALHDAGHRRIGLPFIAGSDLKWAPQRIDLLSRQAAEMGCELITAEMRETFWQVTKRISPVYFMAEFRGDLEQSFRNLDKGVKQRPSMEKELLRRTPSISTLLEKGATALVGLNDNFAREMHLWFRFAGFIVPDDISLISFDNATDCRTVPITTVDFGLSRLGYLAAHLFIGDIRIAAGRKGDVPAHCRLADRGSVARPRTEAARAS